MNADNPNLQIDWTPLLQSGASFGTHRFKRISDDRVDFIPTSQYVVFSLFFLVSGLFVVIRVVFDMGFEEKNFYVGLVIGFLFFATGLYLLFISNNRIIFKNKDGVWRISKSNVLAKRIKYLPTKPLYAIQVLEKHYDNTSYELNVVYTDGSRVNILNQAPGDSVIKNATDLAALTGIPFLNGVKEGNILSKWGEFRPVF